MVRYSCAGASYILDNSWARAHCACSRRGWGVFWTFLLSSILCLLHLPLSGRYRLKYFLKGPLNPKQSINKNITLGSCSPICPSVPPLLTIPFSDTFSYSLHTLEQKLEITKCYDNMDKHISCRSYAPISQSYSPLL